MRTKTTSSIARTLGAACAKHQISSFKTHSVTQEFINLAHIKDATEFHKQVSFGYLTQELRS